MNFEINMGAWTEMDLRAVAHHESLLCIRKQSHSWENE